MEGLGHSFLPGLNIFAAEPLRTNDDCGCDRKALGSSPLVVAGLAAALEALRFRRRVRRRSFRHGLRATYTFAMIDRYGSPIFCWGVVALLFGVVSLRAQSYSLGPDSQPQDGVPKGTVTKHVLAAGVFYPGTPHNYAVYVPAQYDANKPTPFMVFLRIRRSITRLWLMHREASRGWWHGVST